MHPLQPSLLGRARTGLGVAGGGPRTVQFSSSDQLLACQRLHPAIVGAGFDGLGAKRGELGLGLGNLFVARADLQRFQLCLRAQRIGLCGSELRVATGGIKLHQHGARLDRLTFAHLHCSDHFGRRCRHRDPVPLHRSQRSRR